MVWCGDENTPYKILTCPYYFRGCGSWFNKIRWKYVRVIASGAAAFLWSRWGWVMGALKFGMICYNHHLSSGPRPRKVRGQGWVSVSKQVFLHGDRTWSRGQDQDTVDKNRRTNHTLEGKMINNGYVEWNINNGESTVLIYSPRRGRAEKNPGRQPG